MTGSRWEQKSSRAAASPAMERTATAMARWPNTLNHCLGITPKGLFKFTSTPYGSKPRRSDLIRTLRRGVTGTSMPSFADLAPDDLDAVVDYVIFLSQRGELEHELASIADQEGS